MKEKNRPYLLLIIIIAIISGYFIGYYGTSNTKSQYFPLQQITKQNKISTILSLVENEYVDTVNLDKLVENSIPRILEDLDPHTVYISEEEMKAVNEEMRGDFSGIGVQFSIQEDTVRVVDVIQGGPSSRVGIQPGDRIVTVNDSLIAGVGVKNETILSILRGKKNTKVKVGIFRKNSNEILNFEITRDIIPINSVDVAYKINDLTGYIKITRFSQKTYDEVMEGMEKLDQQGVEKVILDVRQNGGGSLSSVLQILDEFLANGQPILYTQGLHQAKRTYNSSGKSRWKNKDLIVLIDEFSASASEILAGAIQDNDRGLIIGRRSFGKGLVQEQIMMRDGSSLRLTVARFYTPSGRSIQKPYDNGAEDYYADIIKRMAHHEQFEKDSIHLADSLKYETVGGRTVYGGGGIMPDIFVPIDTTYQSEYFNQIYRKGLIYSFAYAYTDQNRSRLKNYTSTEKLSTFLDADKVLSQFITYAKEKGVAKDVEGIKKSGSTINTQLKAYIARNMLGEEGFYPVIKQNDETLLKAIEIAQSNFMKELTR